MEVLRLKIYQPHAHYRIPFTFARRHTYPIPPYSTIIGFICNIFGIKNQNEEKFQKLRDDLQLAIYGKFESMTREYIWFRNLNKKSHVERFGSSENRNIDQIPEHPGGQMPIRIDVLENVNLLIYIYHSNREFLNHLELAFKNPRERIYSLHLGRAEDLIVFDGNPDEAIKVVEISEERKPIYGKVDYYTWIPDPKKAKENLDKNIYPQDFENYFRMIKGSPHLITSFYKIENGIRNFNYIPVKLFEQGDFPFYMSKPFKFVIDEELNIPLFLCKMIYPRR